MPFSFDPILEAAETLPAHLYTDPAWLEREQRDVFSRTWQLVGRADDVKSHGDFFTATIGREPIVVVRKDEELRAFYNVCRHRGGPLAEGCGSRKTLQCRYHGWTYSLEGQLLRAPEMEGVAGFSVERTRLPPVRVEAWGPLVFANLDPDAPALSEWLEDIPERAAALGLGALTHVTRRDYVIECNWKTYVDNYLEGYHLPIVHPGLYAELDYAGYRVETRRFSSRQVAPLRAATPEPGPARRYAGEGGAPVEYFWVFPNLMLNIYLGQMQTNLILPVGPEQTLTVFDWYAAEAPAGDAARARFAELAEFSHEIQLEDIAICEAVQRNLRSRSCERGRYSVKRENGVHHFHGLLHEFLSKSV